MTSKKREGYGPKIEPVKDAWHGWKSPEAWYEHTKNRKNLGGGVHYDHREKERGPAAEGPPLKGDYFYRDFDDHDMENDK